MYQREDEVVCGMRDWRNIKLGEVTEINPSLTELKIQNDEIDVSFVPMTAVNALLGIIDKSETRKYKEVRKGYTYFRNNDVLFAKITPCMQNGKVAIARSLLNSIGFGSTEFHVIRPTVYILSEWIYLFLRQPTFLLNAANYMQGAVGQQRLPEDYLFNTYIPLPPLEEQKRIVGIIDDKLNIIEKLKRSNIKQKENREALFKKFLNSVKNNDTKQYLINDFCTLRTGGTPDSTNESYYKNGTIPWLVSGDIHKGLIKNSEKYITEEGKNHSNAKILPKGSVLIALNGQGKTRGTVAMLEMEGATCNQSLVSIMPDSNIALSKYVYFNLLSRYEEIRALTGDNERSGLSIAKINKIKINLPSIDLQKQIIKKLEKQIDVINKIGNLLEEQSNNIDYLFPSILRQAFQGKL